MLLPPRIAVLGVAVGPSGRTGPMRPSSTRRSIAGFCAQCFRFHQLVNFCAAVACPQLLDQRRYLRGVFGRGNGSFNRFFQPERPQVHPELDNRRRFWGDRAIGCGRDMLLMRKSPPTLLAPRGWRGSFIRSSSHRCPACHAGLRPPPSPDPIRPRSESSLTRGVAIQTGGHGGMARRIIPVSHIIAYQDGGTAICRTASSSARGTRSSTSARPPAIPAAPTRPSTLRHETTLHDQASAG
jgi:hypothetical protein